MLMAGKCSLISCSNLRTNLLLGNAAFSSVSQPTLNAPMPTLLVAPHLLTNTDIEQKRFSKSTGILTLSVLVEYFLNRIKSNLWERHFSCLSHVSAYSKQAIVMFTSVEISNMKSCSVILLDIPVQYEGAENC